MEVIPVIFLDLLVFIIAVAGFLGAVWYGRCTVARYWQCKKMYMIVLHIVTWCIGFVFFMWTGMEWAMVSLPFEAGVLALRGIGLAINLFWIWTLFLLFCLYIFDGRILRWRDACASAAFIDCLLLIQATWHGALIYVGLLPPVF